MSFIILVCILNITILSLNFSVIIFGLQVVGMLFVIINMLVQLIGSALVLIRRLPFAPQQGAPSHGSRNAFGEMSAGPQGGALASLTSGSNLVPFACAALFLNIIIQLIAYQVLWEFEYLLR